MPDQKPNPQSYLTPIAIIVAGILIAGAVVVKDQVQIKFGGNNQNVAGDQTAKNPADTTNQQPKADLSALPPIAADAIYGNKNAKVKVTVFSDFACPYCAAAAGLNESVMTSLKSSYAGWEPVIPGLLKYYVETGKIALIYREFPIHAAKQDGTLNTDSPVFKSAEAVQCAAEQGKYEEMSQKLFATPTDWESLAAAEAINKFVSYGNDLGINIGDCLKTGKHIADVTADYNAGKKLLVTGTPTFFVNDTAVVGAQPYSEFKKQIDALL